MNSFTKTILLLAWTAATLVTARAADTFDRYQVILEREPFGAPPPEPAAPPPPPMEEEPPWAKTYRLCSVYESNGNGIQVALVDNKTNKPVMLTLGKDPVEGIELLSANVQEEEAVLTKDGRQVTMKVEASKAPPPRTATKAPPRATTATPTRPPTIISRPPGSSDPRRGVIRSVRQ